MVDVLLVKTLNKALSIRSLNSTDAPLLAAFINSQSAEYLRFFYAFGSQEHEISEILSGCIRDVYSGLYWNDDLIGVFMLRGWDEGYEVPSFGVLIDEKHRGGPLMRLALDAAKFVSRLSGSTHLMAKVHPDNGGRLAASRLGFRRMGVEESTGNIIYHMEL